MKWIEFVQATFAFAFPFYLGLTLSAAYNGNLLDFGHLARDAAIVVLVSPIAVWVIRRALTLPVLPIRATAKVDAKSGDDNGESAARPAR